jgi:hypothetical protein
MSVVIEFGWGCRLTYYVWHKDKNILAGHFALFAAKNAVLVSCGVLHDSGIDKLTLISAAGTHA